MRRVKSTAQLKVQPAPACVKVPPSASKLSAQEQIKLKTWQNARQVIKDEFQDKREGSMRHAFLCNIAMYLQDRWHMGHGEANCAAEHLIKLVFEDTYY